MTSSMIEVVPIKDAAEPYGYPNIDAFEESAKQLDCLVTISGRKYLDVANFYNRLRKEVSRRFFQSKQEEPEKSPG